MFESNPDVSFGDINLSKEQIRGNHSPGQGGWPTIKYFNKETGYEGASYVKKTDAAMCTELGNDDNMRAYVEEAGKTALCNILATDGCSEKEKEYIAVWTEKSADEVTAQKQRLEKMGQGKMKPSLLQWVKQRLGVLAQIEAGAPPAKEEL